MINSIQLIRNIGQFDSVTTGAQNPFTTFTLIYAENGRGKTTLSAIFRSLASGDPILITERRRLGAQHLPHVVIDCDGGPPLAVFQNNAWNRYLSNLVVFDDLFVDQNVHSGLVLEPGHRQNLHELILGAQGVTLNQQLQALIDRIENHNTALRIKTAAVPTTTRGTYSIDDFCALQPEVDIDNKIRESERQLAAVREQDPIRNTLLFDVLSLPSFDLDFIEELLSRDLPNLNEAAAEQVRIHLSRLELGGEQWVAEGMHLMTPMPGDQITAPCPFCAQDVGGSPVIQHYQAYFSAAYAELKQSIANALAAIIRDHDGNVPATFERTVRIAGERQQFWSQFCDVAELGLDTEAIVRDWSAAYEAVVQSVEAKQASPLETLTLTDDTRNAVSGYENHRQIVALLNRRLQQANTLISAVKLQSTTGNPATLESEIARLKATKARHSPAISILCNDYLAEKLAKSQTEHQRDQARIALDQYRTGVFPAYQIAINNYLNRFNAGFRLDNVMAANTRGGTACNYEVVINNTPVPVAGGTPATGEPSFRNTLSAGDRNALALAFFLASLDQDPLLANKTVLIDDPISSLDEHRSLTTVQEIRRLAGRTGQVIVLSHNKSFLCHIWEGVNPNTRSALEVVSAGAGSIFREWNVNRDCLTENDRRHTLLREYLDTGTPNNREVAQSIRPVVEAFLRVACPLHFPPGTLLGPFRNICEQRAGTPQQILDNATIQELRDITEYANKFHHDTNPAWATEAINDTELSGYIRRTLAIIQVRV